MGKSNYETHVATLQKVGVVNVASLRQVDPGQPYQKLYVDMARICSATYTQTTTFCTITDLHYKGYMRATDVFLLCCHCFFMLYTYFLNDFL